MRIKPFDEYGSLTAIFNVAPDSIHIRTGASDAIAPFVFIGVIIRSADPLRLRTIVQIHCRGNRRRRFSSTSDSETHS